MIVTLAPLQDSSTMTNLINIVIYFFAVYVAYLGSLVVVVVGLVGTRVIVVRVVIMRRRRTRSRAATILAGRFVPIVVRGPMRMLPSLRLV